MLADFRVVYLFVYVSDLAASRAFYKDMLGLRVIEEEDGCVKFDCGHVILALNRAADYNIPLPKGRDHSTDTVFLVDNVAEMRAALERRGVNFLPTSTVEPGEIADFYDPDGHWLSLYQPSEEALTWPSGKRLRTVINARQHRNGNGSALQALSRASDEKGYVDRVLDGSAIVYVFLFVRNAAEAQVFYHDDLGLHDLEGGPCSQTSTGDEEGVIKYDTGGILISTHHIEPTRSAAEVEEHLCPPRELIDGHLKSVAPVFYVRNAEHVVKTLSRRRADLSPTVMQSGIGVVASFEDPSGHLLFLYEPSEEALRTPSGQKIREIMATAF